MKIFDVPNKRDVIDFGRFAQITDFALLEEILINPNLKVAIRNLESFDVKDVHAKGAYCYISYFGKLSETWKDYFLKYCCYGIRPVIRDEAFDLIKDEFRNKSALLGLDYYIADYGSYMQNLESDEKLRTLRLWQHFNFERDGKVLESTSLGLEEHIFQEKDKYAMLSRDIFSSCPEKKSLFNKPTYWFKIEPLGFIVNEKRRVAICSNIIQMRSDIITGNGYDKLLEYMNGPLAKDIIPPDSKLYPHIKSDTIVINVNTDIDCIIRKIMEIASKDAVLKKRIEKLLIRLTDTYNCELSNIKIKRGVIDDGVSLTLESPKTKEDIKKDFVEKLENVLSTLNTAQEKLVDYFDMLYILSKCYSRISVDSEESPSTELEKDILVILSGLKVLSDDKKAIGKARLHEILRNEYEKIQDFIAKCIIVTQDNCSFSLNKDLKTFTDLELEVRESWHPFLIDLSEMVSSAELLKKIDEGTKEIVNGLYVHANDSMASVYLREIDERVSEIRKFVNELSVDERESVSSELLDILNGQSVGEKRKEILQTLRNKLILLNRLHAQLDEYSKEISDIKNYSYNPNFKGNY